jgi:hypothetical protein
MKHLLMIAAALLAALVTPAAAQNQTTFRDSGGRTIGTATRDSNGTTTFRDAGGRTTGTATKDSNAQRHSVTPAVGPPTRLRSHGADHHSRVRATFS